MISSMTGFGEAKAEDNGVAYRVEIRSLNNRYFKATIKTPETYQRFETEIDKLLRTRLGRGTITYSLRMHSDNIDSALSINDKLLAEYLHRIQAVAASCGASVDAASLLELPGVLSAPDLDDAELDRQFAIVRRLTLEAMDRLIEMRRTEGRALAEDLRERCEEIRGLVEQIRGRSPLVLEEYHRRLNARLQQLLGGVEGASLEPHRDAISREVAMYAERCDVNEEISRIASHLDQLLTLCNSPEEAGRKLDFLAQELLREANTIGSKSNDAEISRNVVGIKAAIDRIKEQVQNVE